MCGSAGSEFIGKAAAEFAVQYQINAFLICAINAQFYRTKNVLCIEAPQAIILGQVGKYQVSRHKRDHIAGIRKTEIVTLTFDRYCAARDVAIRVDICAQIK